MRLRNRLSPSRFAGFLLLLSGLTCVAAAQTAAQTTPQVTAMAVGSYTADYRKSLVFIEDGRVFFHWDPTTHQARSPIAGATSATTLARLAGRAADGRDQFLFTHAAGVSVGTFDSTSNSWVVAAQPAGQGWTAWASARHLSATEHATEDNRLIACVDQSGQQVHIIAEMLDGSFQTSATASLSGQHVNGIVCLDWDDSTPSLEVAVLHSGGVVVFDSSGTQILSLPSFGDNAVCALMRESGGDRMVWSSKILGLHYLFLANATVATWRLVDTGSLSSPGPLLGIATGDCDGDNDSDVLLSFAGTSQALLVKNQPSPEFHPINFGAVEAMTVSSVLCFPFRPGRLHALGFEDGGAAPRLVYLKNLEPSVAYFEDPPGEPPPDTSFIASATLDSTNTLELTIADGVVGSSATLIEARLWYQADPLSFPAALLDPDWLAMDTVVVQTQGNTGQASMADPAVLSLALDGPNSTFATAPVLHWPNRDHYWGEIRIIDQTSGRVLRVEGIGLTYSDIPDASVQVDSSYLIGQSDNRTLGWTRIDPEGEAGTQAAQSLGIQRGRVYTRLRGPRFPSSSVPDTTN